jgi:transposase
MNEADRNALKAMLAARKFDPYISHIRFPHYKNLAPDLKIDFDFPITALVGPNGTNKSSILRAIQGSPGNENLGVYWFSTSTDPIAETGARNAFKIHAVVDTYGLPVHLALTPGEAHENRLCSVLLSALLPQTMLLADRGYDADWIGELARQRGAWANIPPKRNRKDPICFSPYLYRARNLIERFFNKIKQCRRVATRYDKLAANYLAFIKLASIRIWLRANESTP